MEMKRLPRPTYNRARAPLSVHSINRLMRVEVRERGSKNAECFLFNLRVKSATPGSQKAPGRIPSDTTFALMAISHRRNGRSVFGGRWPRLRGAPAPGNWPRLVIGRLTP